MITTATCPNCESNDCQIVAYTHNYLKLDGSKKDAGQIEDFCNNLVLKSSHEYRRKFATLTCHKCGRFFYG